jgi:hypothetical protein
MKEYLLKHKKTQQEVKCKAHDENEALQIYCSETTFSKNLSEQLGWWKREEVDITELSPTRQ